MPGPGAAEPGAAAGRIVGADVSPAGLGGEVASAVGPATTQRGIRRAERAEWRRLSAILAAHRRASDPAAPRRFVGTLDQLRATVAALPPLPATRPTAARAGTLRDRGRHHDPGSRRRQDAERARHAQARQAQHTGTGRTRR